MSWYLAALNNYAGFRGRAQRREYWMFVLVNAIIGVALVVIGKLTKMPDGPTFGIGMSRNGLGVFGIGVFSNPVLFQVYALATLLPFLAVEVRRLHDIGRTGWWWLFGLVPVLGWIVLVVFCATDGIAGGNRYGPDPKAAGQLQVNNARCADRLSAMAGRSGHGEQVPGRLSVAVVVCREAFVLDLDDVSPAVGLGAVGVGEAVDRCQLAGG
jgi:uncharacterized membrane protein YhaH (DUF805 family)